MLKLNKVTKRNTVASSCTLIFFLPAQLPLLVAYDRFGMKVKIKKWAAVATWRWDIPDDDVCGICQIHFDGSCPSCRFPGDDCALCGLLPYSYKTRETNNEMLTAISIWKVWPQFPSSQFNSLS